MEGVTSSYDPTHGPGSSSTVSEPLWLWDNDFQNDSLPFFSMDPATQWQNQDDFKSLHIDHVHLSSHSLEERLSKTAANVNKQNPETDMNDPKVLDLYMQLAFFQKDIFSQELLFVNPDHALQHLIHTLARKLNFEYEHSLALHQVRISRVHCPLSTNLDIYPVPNQSTIFDPENLSSGVSGDDLFSLPSTLDLNQVSSTTRKGYTNLLLGPSDQVESGPSKSFLEDDLGSSPEIRTLDPSQVHYTDYTLHGIDSPVSSAFESSPASVALGGGQPQHGDNDRLMPRKLTFTAKGSYTNITKRLGPTSAPQDFIFVPEGAQCKRNDDSLSNASRKDAKILAENGGACWRCKFVRKKCQGKNNGICERCHKGDSDPAWQIVGCRRGQLDRHVTSIMFCPKRSSSQLFKDVFQPSSTLNLDAKEHKRKPRVPSILSDIFDRLESSTFSTVPFPGPSTLVNRTALLNDAVEISENSPEYSHVIELSLGSFLRCLEFEATMDCFYSFAHVACTTSTCTVDSTNTLSRIFKDYFNELSRVMFQKKNLRGDKAWRLPTFYSLCIQGLARKFLFSLPLKSIDNSSPRGLEEYLQLVVQLFRALAPGFYSVQYIERWLIHNDGTDKFESSFRNPSDFLEQLFSRPQPTSLPNPCFYLPSLDSDVQTLNVSRSKKVIFLLGDDEMEETEEGTCEESLPIVEKGATPGFQENDRDSTWIPQNELDSAENEDLVGWGSFADRGKLPTGSNSQEIVTDQGTSNITDLAEDRTVIQEFKNAESQTAGDIPGVANDFASLPLNYSHMTAAFDELVKSLEKLKVNYSQGDTSSKSASIPAHSLQRVGSSSTSLKRKSRTPSRAGSHALSRAGSRMRSDVVSPAVEPFPDFFEGMPKTGDLWTQSQEVDVFENDHDGGIMKKQRSWIT